MFFLPLSELPVRFCEKVGFFLGTHQRLPKVKLLLGVHRIKDLLYRYIFSHITLYVCIIFHNLKLYLQKCNHV